MINAANDIDPFSLTGQQVDQYYVNAHIARGGMADVYLAHEASLKRDVILKVLLPELARNDELALRFRREAQATAQLNHPNIVTIHEIAEDDEQTFIVLEYVRRLRASSSLAKLKYITTPMIRTRRIIRRTIIRRN